MFPDSYPSPGEPVDLAIEGDIAIVTLNRPAARNAIDRRTMLALAKAVAAVESGDGVRAAIITGVGPVFCAGADLKEVAAGGLEGTFDRSAGFAAFVNARRQKPWIAAVNGPALAGGFEIVLACDLVVAAADARFGLPEVTRGLIASAGGLYRLPRSIPRVVANELILSGAPIDAARAFDLGLVNRVVPTPSVLAAARELAAGITGNAPLAVRESLSLARAASRLEDDDLRVRGDIAQRYLASTRDYQEGADAFVAKRHPAWKGH